MSVLSVGLSLGLLSETGEDVGKPFSKSFAISLDAMLFILNVLVTISNTLLGHTIYMLSDQDYPPL